MPSGEPAWAWECLPSLDAGDPFPFQHTEHGCQVQRPQTSWASWDLSSHSGGASLGKGKSWEVGCSVQA